MTHLNAKAVRELALHYASTPRAQVKFTRVSKDFLERIDAKVRSLVPIRRFLAYLSIYIVTRLRKQLPCHNASLKLNRFNIGVV